ASGSRVGARGLRHGTEVLIATDTHLDAPVAEPGKVVLQLDQTVIAERRRHGDLESRAATRAERVLGDYLRGVRGEPPRAMYLSARTRRVHARPYGGGRRALTGPHLGLTPLTNQRVYGREKVSEGANVVDRRLGDGNAHLV